MKIAIIGGGWVGSHLALKLKNIHSVTLFEKNDFLFQETSYKNQNRLHLGFHYPRSYETRDMCKKTFNKFISEYGFLTKKIKKNYYCVPKKKSIIDFDTFKDIFRDFKVENIYLDLKNVEGCVKTNERYIDFKKSFKYFNNQLKNLKVKENINEEILKKISEEFDLVINATNNHLLNFTDDYFFELTLTFIYEKKEFVDFEALTLMDGNFFSIYPYSENSFTLTDVEYTPLKKFKTIEDLSIYKDNITEESIKERLKLFEEKVILYYPEFLNKFSYKDFFISTKVKKNSSSDSRYPIIEKHGNIINCFTGKIQGIYIIEEYINKVINENFSR